MGKVINITKRNSFILFLLATSFIMLMVDIFIYCFTDIYSSVIRVDTGYYAYLPAVFLHNFDFSFSFLNDTSDFLVQNVNRYPIGVAICWMPFWLVGHCIYLLAGIQDTGYGNIHQTMVLISGIFYWAVGITCTYKILLKKFDKKVSLFSCVLITYGTRLFYYSTIDAALSHVYSFALIAILGWCFISYIEQRNALKVFACGILLGLITDIRNVNIIVAIIPLAYLSVSCIEKKRKVTSALKDLLLAAVGTFVGFSPMMLYWKSASGSWVYNSYGQWSFDWLHPHAIQTLFGEDSITGMIKLSPILLLIIPGFVLMYRNYRSKLVTSATLVCLMVDLYLIFCCWAPAGLGRRNYINFLSIIAFVFAYVIDWKEKDIKHNVNYNIALNVFCFAAVTWNILEMIHYCFYWEI